MQDDGEGEKKIGFENLNWCIEKPASEMEQIGGDPRLDNMNMG